MPEIQREKYICWICSHRPAKFVCGRCHSVDYCGRKCQRMDWSRHKRLCAPVIFRQLDHIGRGLVATKDINRGDLIFTAKAFISINKDTDEFTSDINDEIELEKFQKLPKISKSRNRKKFKILKAKTGEVNLIDSEADIENYSISGWKYNNDSCYKVENISNFFLSLAYIRHQCSPNASTNKVFEKPTVVEVRAIKDIKVGEEVTINYLVVFHEKLNVGKETFYFTKEERRNHLARWEITCTCSHCKVGKDQDVILRMKLIESKKKIETCGCIGCGISKMNAFYQEQLVDILRKSYLGSLLLPLECPKLVYLSYIAGDSRQKFEKTMRIWENVIDERNVDLFQEHFDRIPTLLDLLQSIREQDPSQEKEVAEALFKELIEDIQQELV